MNTKHTIRPLSARTRICGIASAFFSLGALVSTPARAGDEHGLYQTFYFISCTAYEKDRKEPVHTGRNAVDEIYIRGWLSGYNYLTPNTYNIVPNGDIGTVLSWLDNFCKNNPKKNIESGLLQLTDELYPKRIQAYKHPADSKPASDSKTPPKPDNK